MPSTAEYWLMGETTTRFESRSPRSRNGVNIGGGTFAGGGAAARDVPIAGAISMASDVPVPGAAPLATSGAAPACWLAC